MKTHVTGQVGKAPLKGDTTQINISDIWRPEEGVIFSRSAVPRSTEILNPSVTNDSAQQQLRSGSQKETRNPIHCLISNISDERMNSKKHGCLVFRESCQKSKRNSKKEFKC